MMEGINGFVLAGGRSRRMGQEKALMRLEGKPLVLRAAEILRPFVSKVTLLAPADRYGNLGLPVLEDQWPDQGPLAAVCTGLISSTTEWNIFLACDLPRVSPQFIQFLVERVSATRADAAAPRTLEGWQPLSAAYHSRCRTALTRAFQAGERSLIRLFDELRVEAITPEEMVRAGLGEEEFTNMNTPEDWARITGLSKGGR
jgi:molybdopterin-guanine dinucleotide biosynthesis protein A